MDKEYVVKDMHRSMTYLDMARPIITKLIGGHTVAVEGDKNQVCKILDLNCGIDYLQVYENGLCSGIASRFQDYPNMRTFTVRKARESGAMTELQKREMALEHGCIYPVWTMQGYVQHGQIVGLGITNTRSLIWFVNKGYAKPQRTGADQMGQASFFVCEWDEMKRKGIRVIEWP